MPDQLEDKPEARPTGVEPREAPELGEAVRREYDEFFREPSPLVPFEIEPGDVLIGLQRDIASSFQIQSRLYQIAVTMLQKVQDLIDATNLALPFTLRVGMSAGKDDRILNKLILEKVDQLPENLQASAQALIDAMDLFGISVEDIRKRLKAGEKVRFVYFNKFTAAQLAAGEQIKVFKTVMAAQGLKQADREKYTGYVRECEKVKNLLGSLAHTMNGTSDDLNELKPIVDKIMDTLVNKNSKKLVNDRVRVTVALHRAYISPEEWAKTQQPRAAAVAVADAPTAQKVSMGASFNATYGEYLNSLAATINDLDPELTIVWVRMNTALDKVRQPMEQTTMALEQLAALPVPSQGGEPA